MTCVSDLFVFEASVAFLHVQVFTTVSQYCLQYHNRNSSILTVVNGTVLAAFAEPLSDSLAFAGNFDKTQQPDMFRTFFLTP